MNVSFFVEADNGLDAEVAIDKQLHHDLTGGYGWDIVSVSEDDE